MGNFLVTTLHLAVLTRYSVSDQISRRGGSLLVWGCISSLCGLKDWRMNHSLCVRVLKGKVWVTGVNKKGWDVRECVCRQCGSSAINKPPWLLTWHLVSTGSLIDSLVNSYEIPKDTSDTCKHVHIPKLQLWNPYEAQQWSLKCLLTLNRKLPDIHKYLHWWATIRYKLKQMCSPRLLSLFCQLDGRIKRLWGHSHQFKYAKPSVTSERFPVLAPFCPPRSIHRQAAAVSW